MYSERGNVEFTEKHFLRFQDDKHWTTEQHGEVRKVTHTPLT